MLYIGVDLGTSAVKLLLMAADGKIENIVSKEYPLFFNRRFLGSHAQTAALRFVEQNPRDFFNCAGYKRESPYGRWGGKRRMNG